MSQIQYQTTQPLVLVDDDSETIEVDMEEFFRNESLRQNDNTKTPMETPRTQLPSLANVLGTSSLFPNTNQSHNQSIPIPLPNSIPKALTVISSQQNYHNQIKPNSIKNQSLSLTSSKEITIDSSEEKKPKKQFKTEPRRLTYLRQKKIFGRNEESEIINGLQYLLIHYHGASFDYVKEKRSKKTVKFRMPYSMTYMGNTYSSNLVAEMGEHWLIDRGLCLKCNEKIVTAKRIQRSKEAEVNGGLICILHSLGYDFEFKKLKDKFDRKTTPFVKISQFKYPNETEFRNVEELKKLGRKYNDIMLMQEEVFTTQN